MYRDDRVLCGELEEELKVMEGWFVDQSNDIRQRRGNGMGSSCARV